MGRIFSVSFAGTITAAGTDADLLEIIPADDKPVRLRGFCLGQTSEIGDAQEEGLRIQVIVLQTITTGNGTATTPKAPDVSADTNYGGTCKTYGTTLATGTSQVLGEFAWNERNSPYDFWYPDVAFCPKARQPDGFVVRMNTTPADDFSAAMTFWIEEE